MWLDILIGLAVWRVALMLTQERGLFAVFEKLRYFFRAWTIPPFTNGETPTPRGEIGELLSCVWCLSIWISGIAVLLAGKPVWYLLPYSAIAILAHEWAMRG